MSEEERVVLDEMQSPDGALELFAYRDREAAWVGVRKKGIERGSFGAIGIGTGSTELQIEASATIDRTYAVAFGAVAPGIVRAEVRNDDDESFEATIHPLPPGSDTDYRAVWGLAERCRQTCEIVGFDARGRLYDGMDPKVTGPEPTDTERLQAIHLYTDESMRYYATAYLRETKENRRHLDSYMGLTAHYASLLEGPALGTRSVLGRRDKIIKRYLQQAETDPVEFGSCSFCGASPVAAWFEGPSFKTFVRRSDDVRAQEAWLACDVCLRLVEADDREALARRGARERADPPESLIRAIREDQKERFWTPRDSS